MTYILYFHRLLQLLRLQHGLHKQKKRGRPPKATTEQTTTENTSQQTPEHNNEGPEAPLTQEMGTETAKKKKRGRPPKASNTQVQTRKGPAGVGVLIGDDGHTYLSSSRSTIRLTESRPSTTTQSAEGVPTESSSQPTKLH